MENFAREPLRPGEQAAALMYQRCAVLVGKLLRAGKPVPGHVYAITDSVERFKALEKIRGTDQSCAAPWTEVLSRLGLQLTERKATELVRAFRELPRELTEEMDEEAVRLNTRIKFAALRRGREAAAADIWAALKSSSRLHLLPSAVDIGLTAPELEPDEVIEAAEERLERANAGRRRALTRVPEPLSPADPETDGADDTEEQIQDAAPDGEVERPAVAAVPTPPAQDTPPASPPPAPAADSQVIRSALDGLRGLLAEVRAGREVPRYDRGSLRLALRELEQHLADATNPTPIQESENAA